MGQARIQPLGTYEHIADKALVSVIDLVQITHVQVNIHHHRTISRRPRCQGLLRKFAVLRLNLRRDQKQQHHSHGSNHK